MFTFNQRISLYFHVTGKFYLKELKYEEKKVESVGLTEI